MHGWADRTLAIARLSHSQNRPALTGEAVPMRVAQREVPKSDALQLFPCLAKMLRAEPMRAGGCTAFLGAAHNMAAPARVCLGQTVKKPHTL